MARKFDTSQSYVRKIIKENGVTYRKRKRVPDSKPEQELRARSRCLKLRRDFFPPSSTTQIVMDDESYFGLKDDNINVNKGYYISESLSAKSLNPRISYIRKSKYPPKLLIWLAISKEGISEPCFCPRNLSITGEIYRNQCIKKHLIPFLEKFHDEGKYYFWPDLASSYYAKDTLKLFEDLNIPYIPKSANPPNTPQLRPIEDFWGYLKSKVYEGGWEAKSFRMLKQRIRKSIRQVEFSIVQRLFSSVKTNIRKSADNGPLAAIH
ncbi:hypothetical protein LOD99_8817 [Oopsacas minuta]|uniref:Transposase n=1 Tax=Oopsacas minuta TaxID=111878 RepID=A0AAV7JFE2_9METZ|nr:hypothetical protein LOD99_8817 [Oopsacas minuta]